MSKPRTARSDVLRWLERRPRRRPQAIHERVRLLNSALIGVPSHDEGRNELPTAQALLADAAPEATWLALAVLGGKLPTSAEVSAARMRIRLDGPRALLDPLLRRLQRSPRLATSLDVLVGQVVIDVHHTAQTDLATGIQRVARETTQRWMRHHTATLVGWDRRSHNLRRLTTQERARILGNDAVDIGDEPAVDDAGVVIPFGGVFLLPELAVEDPRTKRLQGLAEFSGCRTGALGFDCVPVTSAETTGEGMGGAFAGSLAAIRHFDRVGTISRSAAGEYSGWVQMLRGAGLAGPEVREVMLPVESRESSPEDLEEGRRAIAVGSLPILLCVGSHEPRKNHLAVLHAAEMLWREGHQFSLSFIGGNAWRSEEFRSRLRQLQAEDRPVQSSSAVPDRILWAAYRMARVVVFPSLNEGFGLPAAEALACGTPVITSDYGSMREIADGGGALTIDPRKDEDLVKALRRVLTDDALVDRLRDEAARRPTRTWDDYADETWEYLVDQPLMSRGGG